MRMRPLAVSRMAASILATACLWTFQALAADTAQVAAIAESYFDDALALTPTLATKAGDHRYDDRLEDSATPAYQQAVVALARRYLAQLKRVDTAALDEPALVTYDVLSDKLNTTLAGERFPDYVFSVDQISGLQETFLRLGSGDGAQEFKTVADYERFLKRSDAFVVWVDHAISSMRDGMRHGLTHPRPVVERIVQVLHAIGATNIEASPFWQPIRAMPPDFSQDQRVRLTATWRAKMKEQVLPAYLRLADFMEREYLPHARTTVGWSALPNGAAWYRYAIRRNTTLDLSPDEVHQTGLREVARLRSEMDVVRVRVGYKGNLAAFLRFMQTDPQFYFKSGTEMLASYRDVKTRVDARLPTLFRHLPRMDYEVREMESYRAAHVPGGQYQAAPPDKSRPGVFFVNTHDLRGLPSYITETLSLHEASPGHHLQVEIAHELQNVPRLQRFASNSAYGEGWALYAESLGKELGLYADPYQWYGHLTEQMLRAMRLVVDTGLHAKGWTRDQAVKYMLENSSMAADSVAIEVDRYIVWPGQALSYQIGKLTISALRARAERELGPKFDVREFHNEILGGGPLPLGALERKVDRWIKARAVARP